MVLAVTVGAAAAAPSDTPRVAITGATAIGVFPPFTERELERDDGSISEGTSHVAFALEDLAKCLEPAKLITSLELTPTLLLSDGRTAHRLEFPDADGKSVAIVLVLPGRVPRVVHTSVGPSSLQWLALDTAATYFGAPKCKRDVK